ncbi:hypothetical protein DFQ28_010099, partial [Apophysomyces sp. BC1034]
MTQGRKLKNKLKSFTVATKPPDNHGNNDTNTACSQSVTSKLVRLRAEQARAEKNRQRLRDKATDDDAHFASPPLLLAPWESSVKQTPTLHNTVAGPPPPLSWTPKTKEVATQRRRRSESGDLPSLCSMCVRQIAYHIDTKYAAYPAYLTKQFLSLPISIKQKVLQNTCLTNRLLKLFGDTPYSDLCLENASISMSRLVQAFWKIRCAERKDNVKQLRDDWEEDTDSDDEGEPDTYTFDLEYQEEDECSYHLQYVLNVLAGNVDLSKRYILFTPLSMTLVSLNISFIRPFLPSTSIAYLISTTLPNLLSLSSAGCFTATEGPRALSIISRGLRRLRFWDIGYHEWIKADLFCEWSPESVINWRKDLKDLQVLHLHYSGRDHSV